MSKKNDFVITDPDVIKQLTDIRDAYDLRVKHLPLKMKHIIDDAIVAENDLWIHMNQDRFKNDK